MMVIKVDDRFALIVSGDTETDILSHVEQTNSWLMTSKFDNQERLNRFHEDLLEYVLYVLLSNKRAQEDLGVKRIKLYNEVSKVLTNSQKEKVGKALTDLV